MNALDFLVDFTAVVCTSEASKPGYDGNNVDRNVDLMGRKQDPMSEICIIPSEGLPPVRKRSADTVQVQSSRAPSLTQQIFSGEMINHPTANGYHYGQYEQFFAFPADPHMSQSFDQFLYQHPGPGLPHAISNDLNYQNCDCERIAHWDSSHGANYLLPAEPPLWVNVQPQPYPPNHDIRNSDMQFIHPVEETPTHQPQCMDTTCHCRYSPPHHQVMSNDFPPMFARHVWGPYASAYDRSVSKEHDEWVWMTAR
jgi:hypothetical protein